MVFRSTTDQAICDIIDAPEWNRGRDIDVLVYGQERGATQWPLLRSVNRRTGVRAT